MIRRILIVEPDLKIAQEMFLLFHFERGRFERDRYEPEIAESVAEAVEQAQTVNFDCIIMDVDLPEMNGYEAVALMKTIANNPPVVMTAAKNSLELETKVRQQDVYYYHLRSFDLDELKSAVGSVFEKLQELKRAGKPSIAAVPIVLKQLRLCQKRKEARNGCDR